MYLDAFIQYFSEIEDSRQSAKVFYPLFDILFVTLCAVTAGAEGWKEIQEYAEGHHDWFKNQGFLKSSVPVDDTIARIISRIKPEPFRLCFIDWMQAIIQHTEGKLVAIDGKTLRSSYNRDDKSSAIHMVSAYAAANKMVIGQVKTADKSNEITAIPELIKLLDLKGALVSIDAMGCQTEIASSILKQGGDYLLSVKGNQGNLHKAVKKALAEKISPPALREETQIEQGHGRIEARQYFVMSADELSQQFPGWENLKTVGVAIGYRQEKDKLATLEYRYYISSAELTEASLAEAVRSHWSIENSLHWVLDATMQEDNCQIYRENAAQNIAILRHISLNLLRAEPTKLSIKLKRKRAWMKTDFLEQILNAGFGQQNEF